MLSNIKQIFDLFSRKERRQVLWLFSGMVVRGLIEVAGVASIMPFIAVVANPEVIHTNRILATLYQFLGLESARIFLLVLGTVVLLVIVLNNVLAAFTDWYLFRFTWLRGYSLSRRLFSKYLSQPYPYFLNVNTAELGANILNEVSYYMKGILRPFMEMSARIIISLFIFILLLAVDYLLAIIVMLVLGSAYMGIFILVRKKLIVIGKERIFNNKKQFIYINETFGGIKDIKVKGCENYFLDAFSKHAYKVNINQATHQIVSTVPRYALEIVAFGGILLIALYFVIVNQNTQEIIPLLALYAFAGYKLMPALQNVFSGIASLKFNAGLVDKLHRDLIFQSYPAEHVKKWQKPSRPLPLKKEIMVENLEYGYPRSEEQVLKGLSLKIEANTTIGLVGTTGAGKTTLVDILLGLLKPGQGEIRVDGEVISAGNHRQWLANIGYVPQHIFLSDQSVKQNIAFGVPPKKIDEAAVINSAKISNLHEFVINELPQGYNTIIGERGVRLSGGQRQRIGIARALYHNPDVLFLDEATSSLDNITEQNVMVAIKNLARQKTIIMIAHRLTTLEDCDIIHFIDGGRVIASGTYDELQAHCREFKELAQLKGDRNDV